MSEPAELLSCRDVRAHGVTARQQRRLVARGEWRQLVPGVVMTGRGTTDQFAPAALLRGGPDAALSHQSATQLWLGRELTNTIHITVPFGSTVADCPGVRYHQTRFWAPPTWWDGLPLVAVDVAAAQVCAADDLGEADRRALVTGLVQLRLTTAAAIGAAAARTPKRARAQVRRLVEEVLAGAESGPEAAFWRAQVEQNRLPLPLLNHPVGNAGRRIDGYLPILRAGYEVQSREHHADTWLADTARMAEILVQDRVALQPVLVSDIEHRMDVALADLEGFWRNRAADLAVPLPQQVRPLRWRP